MSKLKEYMKSKGVKTFTHQPVDELPKLLKENIDGKRYYISPTGEKYPSITTVLSKNNNEGIIAWRKKVGEAKANHIASEAARRGTAVHKLIEDYLNNEELSDTSGVLPLALFTVMKEELDKIDNIQIQEGSMYSDKYKVAGQVDCIAEYDGKLCVIDFKTSTREKKEEWVENYFIQGTAYAEMYEERYGKSIDDILILVVTEQGLNQVFHKKKQDYIPKLIEAIDNFNVDNNTQ